MWYKDLFLELENNKDEEQSKSMEQYMQNKFKFLGIPKPKLNAIIKPYLKKSKKYDFDWDFVDICWSKEYREAQYVAINYLNQNINNLVSDDLNKLKKLVLTKSWWETVDSLDCFVGTIVLKDKFLEKEMLKWSVDNSIWLRRVAIDFQQRYKGQTNEELLKEIIINNLGSNEFFINKAIGWSLREYSKTNQKWVKDFILVYKDNLSKLSIKEASKYIGY